MLMHAPPCLLPPPAGVFDGHGTNGHVAAERTARSVATAVQQCAEQAVVAGAAESSLWWDYESCTNLSEPSALSADSSAAYFSLTLDSAQSCLQVWSLEGKRWGGEGPGG